MKQPLKIERAVFLICACLIITGLSYLYGAYSFRAKLFPYPQLSVLYSTAAEILGRKSNLLLDLTTEDAEAVIQTGAVEDLDQGLVLIVHALPGTRDSRVDIIDRDGNSIHGWSPHWDEIWPPAEAAFFNKDLRPVPGDGMYLHGIDLLPDGSFVANFEHLGSFRMDICGRLMWKKENLGHHAVSYDPQDNTIWVTAENQNPSPVPGMSKVRDWTLQQLSLDGEVLQDISVIEILKKNGLTGLLHLASLQNESVAVWGDTLHLNDVGIFPDDYDSRVFAPGDILFSLRNINGIFVVDPDTLEIKFQSVGQVLRQHDPDFTPDGDITVFDNNNLQPTVGPENGQSYILRIDSETNEIETLVGDREDNRFFTAIMGTHQVLPNGNILVSSSGEGRVYEFSSAGALLWRWSNLGTNGSNNRVYGAIGLPAEMDASFFEEAAGACPE